MTLRVCCVYVSILNTFLTSFNTSLLTTQNTQKEGSRMAECDALSKLPLCPQKNFKYEVELAGVLDENR